MDAMGVVETESDPLAEDVGVFLWRLQRSLEMGFGRRLAHRML
jgi:hypothetical protein